MQGQEVLWQEVPEEGLADAQGRLQAGLSCAVMSIDQAETPSGKRRVSELELSTIAVVDKAHKDVIRMEQTPVSDIARHSEQARSGERVGFCLVYH